jgi:hypothetical protein
MLQSKPNEQHTSKDSPWYTPFMDIQVLPWHEAAHPRSQCFVNFSHSVGSVKLVFTLLVCAMVALNKDVMPLGMEVSEYQGRKGKMLTSQKTQ